MPNGALPPIMYVEPVGDVGGSGMSLLAITGNLDRYAPNVVVPCEGRLAARLREIGVPVHVLPLHSGGRRMPVPFAWSALRLAALSRRLGARLIHANHEFSNRHGWTAARLAGLPYICHVRSIQRADSFRHCWLHLPRVLVANSQATQESFRSQLRAGQHSLVVYNGVDLHHFDGRRTTKERAGFSSREFVILLVARLTPDKGVHVLIQALADLVPRYPFLRAVVAGEASALDSQGYASEMKQLSVRLGVGDRISLVGHVDGVRDLYAAADLVVQPSVSEGFGRVVLEAMAMRLPVIATDVGGPSEIIESGSSGLLISPNNPAALSQAIEQVLENKELAVKLAENGRLTAEQRFSQESHVTQIQALYARVLDRRGN